MIEFPEISKLTEKYLLDISIMAEKDGAEFFIMAVPSKYKLQGKNPDLSFIPFSEKVKKWAQKNKLKYIDLSTPFEIASKNEKLFFDKDIHFNENGHKVVANVLRQEFKNIFNYSRLDL